MTQVIFPYVILEGTQWDNIERALWMLKHQADVGCLLLESQAVTELTWSTEESPCRVLGCVSCTVSVRLLWLRLNSSGGLILGLTLLLMLRLVCLPEQTCRGSILSSFVLMKVHTLSGNLGLLSSWCWQPQEGISAHCHTCGHHQEAREAVSTLSSVCRQGEAYFFNK